MNRFGLQVTNVHTTPPAPHTDRCGKCEKEKTCREKVIRQLRMIADDLEKGCNGFDFLLDYDFTYLYFDISEGKQKRLRG